MKIIIDCDPGIDDIYAISLASTFENAEILAFTIVNGNAPLDNCAINAKLLINRLYSNRQQPPIYFGAKHSILPNFVPPEKLNFFGKDGLTETTTSSYKCEVDKLKETFLNEKKSNDESHAAIKILELVNKYPNEIVIIAIGPLTNLATALMLSHDPELFTKKIKKLIIMGGNEPENFSNEHVFSNPMNYPEFNFRLDPAAAKIVIDRYYCPILIFTFDSCYRSFSIKTTEIKDEFDKYVNKSEICNFMAHVGLTHRLKLLKPDIFYSCDLAAMIGALCGDKCGIVTKRLENYSIEIYNPLLNGLLKPVNEQNFSENIEICIKMDLAACVDTFKTHLAKLAQLDEAQN